MIIKKIIPLFVSLLFLMTSSIPLVGGQLNPIAVSGWIYLEDASPASNANVTILNINTDFYANTTTDINGQYVTTMSGSDGDIIRVNCSHLGEAGVNNTTVDIGDPTQFCNLSLSIAAIPPDALFTYNQYNLEGVITPHGQTVFFNDYSTDADGWITLWHWVFGDGSTSVGKRPHHTYEKDGSYRVTLTVTDNEGLTDDMSKTVTVETEAREENVSIPPLQPPLYPLEPYLVPEMYQLLRGDKLQVSKEEIIVVVIDTGVTLRMFNNTDMNDIIVLYHPSYKDGLDNNGHGSFINYILHYALEQWAPNSVQYSIKALDKNGECTPAVFLECLDMARDLNPHVITASVGAIGRPADILCQKVDELRGEGIIITVAGGNLGPSKSTILSPACGESALAVGSIDPRKTILDRANDIVSVWSSRGPVLDIFPKPDMVAPGESILGPYKYGEIVLSGTSLSTPFVAAGAMLLYSNNKGMLDAVKTIYGLFGMKHLSAQIVEESLAEGCFDKGDRDSYGWGIMDIEKANGIVFWKCLFWLLLFVGIIAAIIITVLVLYYYFYKKKKAQ